jgi:tRNA uridine 5-carboxymethylaminomethyl modification enzyme
MFTVKQAKTQLMRFRATLRRMAQKPGKRELRNGPWVQILRVEPVRSLLTTVETETKYAGYIAQQERQIERLKKPVSPNSTSFHSGIPGISREIGEKLERVQPRHLVRPPEFPGDTNSCCHLDVYLSLARVC